jgi:hypothetical protein
LAAADAEAADTEAAEREVAEKEPVSREPDSREAAGTADRASVALADPVVGAWGMVAAAAVAGQVTAVTDVTAATQSTLPPARIESLLVRGMRECRSNCEPSFLRGRLGASRGLPSLLRRGRVRPVRKLPPGPATALGMADLAQVQGATRASAEAITSSGMLSLSEDARRHAGQYANCDVT